LYTKNGTDIIVFYGYKSKMFSGDVTVITWYFNEQFNIHCAFIVIIVWSDGGHHLILFNEQFD
jgi:hypothetical protein